MPTNIVVPDLGESVVEATVLRWSKQEGARVAAGETLVELETEKVNLQVSAPRAGVLARIERKAGEDVKIGDVLGVIGGWFVTVKLLGVANAPYWHYASHGVGLWLRPDAIPRLELSARGTTRLGRNSWLAGRIAETRIRVDLPA